MKCPKCGSDRLGKNGFCKYTKKQKYRCKECGAETVNPVSDGKTKNNFSDITPMDESQLRAKYDMAYIIQTALDQLEPGEYLTKEMLCKKCKLSISGGGVSATINSEQFSKYKGKAKGGELIFGHPDRIKVLIEDTVLTEI